MLSNLLKATALISDGDGPEPWKSGFITQTSLPVALSWKTVLTLEPPSREPLDESPGLCTMVPFAVRMPLFPLLQEGFLPAPLLTLAHGHPSRGR